MSGPSEEGSLPPEVPEEFAAAYRAAYERALAEQTGGPQHRLEPEAEVEDQEPEGDHDTRETLMPHRRGPLRVGTHRSAYDDADTDDSRGWFEQVSHSTWFVPLLLALLALLLILGAYAVGRSFAGQVSADESSGEDPRLVIDDDEGDSASVTDQKPGTGAWDGKVTGVDGLRARAGCTSDPGVDASGARVEYDVANLVDDKAGTTWRCDGPAIGERITLRLPEKEPVGEVGLIPGYAKTDDQNKADRYAQNNRVTRVRWTVGDTEVVQKMSGSAKDRSLRAVRVPRTNADKVVLEILAVKRGPRNTTAISEVHVGRAGSAG